MNSRVFISWSGQAAKAVASVLKPCLERLFPGGHFFMSDDEIEVGDRWAAVLDAELEQSDLGIICATSTSVTSPWVIFEAGALAKLKDVSRLCILLIDLPKESLPSPLHRFQCTTLTQDGVLRLVKSIERHLRIRHHHDELSLEEHFVKIWPMLNDTTRSLPPENVPFQRLLSSKDTPLLLVYGKHVDDSKDRFLERGEVAPTVAISRLVERYGSEYVKKHFKTRIGAMLAPSELHDSNIILVGGPRSNNVAGTILSLSNCPIKYLEGTKEHPDHSYVLAGQVYSQKRSEAPIVNFVDHGYLMRLPNPWNEKNYAVLIAGLSSWAADGIAHIILHGQYELPDEAKCDLFASVVRSIHVQDNLTESRIVHTIPLVKPDGSPFWTL